MTLSEEEKQRIVDEEKVRAEARQKYEKPKKKHQKGLWITFIILVLAIIGMASMSGSKNSSNSSSQQSTTIQNTNTREEATQNQNTSQWLSIGEEGILKTGDVDPIFLATDEESFDLLSKALLANDTAGVIELAGQNKVFGVSSGSKVKVVDQKTFIRKVRVLEGVKSVDSDKVGQAGWVPVEWVVKQ
jgi:cell division protein FtsX